MPSSSHGLSLSVETRKTLVKEVSGLKRMVENMKETVAGLLLEGKGADTGSRETTTGVSQDR